MAFREDISEFFNEMGHRKLPINIWKWSSELRRVPSAFFLKIKQENGVLKHNSRFYNPLLLWSRHPLHFHSHKPLLSSSHKIIRGIVVSVNPQISHSGLPHDVNARTAVCPLDEPRSLLCDHRRSIVSEVFHLTFWDDPPGLEWTHLNKNVSTLYEKLSFAFNGVPLGEVQSSVEWRSITFQDQARGCEGWLIYLWLKQCPYDDLFIE